VLVKDAEHALQGGLMIFQLNILLHETVAGLVPNMAVLLADPLDQTPRQDVCVAGIDELVFDRRRTAIEHEHCCAHQYTSSHPWA
jgi:hypothetical protein